MRRRAIWRAISHPASDYLFSPRVRAPGRPANGTTLPKCQEAGKGQAGDHCSLGSTAGDSTEAQNAAGAFRSGDIAEVGQELVDVSLIGEAGRIQDRKSTR